METVNAAPAKRFFVDMLTRDIELKDSILDLLDNCVDGAMRQNASHASTGNTPYEGKWARIHFDGTTFCIEDNCGGIPIETARESAFRLGRADDEHENLPTVGVYGIGMKRALFKIGRESFVESRSGESKFTVRIKRSWLEDDKDWRLPIEVDVCSLEEQGTRIEVTDLREGVARLFANETDFEGDLKREISAYYSAIISKGFKVWVNHESIEPLQIALLFDADAFERPSGIVPYVYEAESGGVFVRVTIGFYRDLPTEEEDDEALSGRPSSERAGITVVCNDRVVLYADKTRMTGWGEAKVPQYHTQFVSIAGIVEFTSNDAGLLPFTTTKRALDGNSELYLTVKEYIREGLKAFTNFTHKWKTSSRERTEVHRTTKALAPAAIPKLIPATSWSKVVKGLPGRKYKPMLPLPKEDDPQTQIRFARKRSDIAVVARYLFDDASKSPSDVGAKCFDDVLAKVAQ